MKVELHAFFKGCFVCLFSSSEQKAPVLLGRQQHAERVSELFHYDFLYVFDSVEGRNFILILREYFPGYMYLQPSAKPDAAETVEVLEEHCTTFALVFEWFSDRGTHFCNDIM